MNCSRLSGLPRIVLARLPTSTSSLIGSMNVAVLKMSPAIWLRSSTGRYMKLKPASVVRCDNRTSRYSCEGGYSPVC